MNLRRPALAPTVAIALAAALLGACAGAPKPPPPTRVGGTIEVSPQVNPSTSRRPSPLLLRIYELKSATAFDSADFMSLYQRDQTALGAELVAKDELMLVPGESKPYAKTLAPETRYLGVLAAYRDVEHATWRGIVAVQPTKLHALTIRVGDLAIDASASPVASR